MDAGPSSRLRLAHCLPITSRTITEVLPGGTVTVTQLLVMVSDAEECCACIHLPFTLRRATIPGKLAFHRSGGPDRLVRELLDVPTCLKSNEIMFDRNIP